MHKQTDLPCSEIEKRYGSHSVKATYFPQLQPCRSILAVLDVATGKMGLHVLLHSTIGCATRNLQSLRLQFRQLYCDTGQTTHFMIQDHNRAVLCTCDLVHGIALASLVYSCQVGQSSEPQHMAKCTDTMCMTSFCIQRSSTLR